MSEAEVAVREGTPPTISVASPVDAIPHEILDFLSNQGGRSVSVRGAPGTGKTSLALELMLRLPGQRYFLSTRVDQARLVRQFPFLASKYACTEVVDLASLRAERLLSKGEASRITSLVTGSPREGRGLDLARFMTLPPPIQDLYSRTPEGAGRATLLVDSWEALLADYASRVEDGSKRSLSEPEFAEAVLTLFLAQGSNVILVRETSEPNAVDYLVDGVIEARREVYQRHVYRSLHLLKLRGVAVEAAEYPFSLADGRFHNLRSRMRAEGIARFAGMACSTRRSASEPFTWGHAQMQGRFSPLLPGAVTFIETVGAASSELVARLNTYIGIANGHGNDPISIVFPAGCSPSVMKLANEPSGRFPNSMRLIWAVGKESEVNYSGFEVPRECLFPFATESERTWLTDELCEFILGPGNGPVVAQSVLSMLTTMCAGNPNRVEALLAALIQKNRDRGGLLVVDGVDGEAGARFLTNEATHHLRIHERDGLHLLENARTGTPLQAILVPNDPPRFPDIELVPVV